MSHKAPLPSLPLDEWEESKLTLHLFLQIVGKIRLALMPPQNHWWHVPLYVSSRGVTTRPIPVNGGAFEIALDLIDHKAGVTSTAGGSREFALPGQSVAEFYRQTFSALQALEIEAQIRPLPYDLPFETPFSEDGAHSAYDPEYVHRFWQILVWTYGVMSQFAGRFVGKTTPVHLFWHSFDLALTRFSGRQGPKMEGGNQVAREAYSHEAISFGFWAGDDKLREPAFYSYTYPEPEGLTEQPLEPEQAWWQSQETGSLAVYRYHDALESADPGAALLAFLESAYQAGARQAGWDLEALTHPRFG
jgi:hypothetical protein